MFLILSFVVLLLIVYKIIRGVQNTNRYWASNKIYHYSLQETIAQAVKGCLGKGFEVNRKVYNNDSDEKIMGIYYYNDPRLLIRDPDLIKQIAIKDFNYFMDHSGILFKEDVDPLLGFNLLGLKGQKWHNLRTMLSPSFSSGKIRNMFPFMQQCSETMVEFYKKKLEMKNQNGTKTQFLEIEVKDLFGLLTNDIIATTAFGYPCDSFNDSKNNFIRLSKAIFSLSVFRLITYVLFGKILKLFQMRYFTEEIHTYFTTLLTDNIAKREKENIVRPDMVHFLMEIRKKTKNSNGIKKNGIDTAFTDDELTAQAFTFLLAGFDSVSNPMSLASYELAINPDVQKKLQMEVDKAYNDCNGNLTYDIINHLPYLEMVVTETLRKWPSFVQTIRTCTQSYSLHVNDKHGERDIPIEKDTIVQIPIYGIHYDPKYYPDPEKFHPERFNVENKKKYSAALGNYLPFGLGPRHCIGSRFALIEVKVSLFNMVRNFDFIPIKKTQIPLKKQLRFPSLIIKQGIWLGLKLRDVNNNI